MRYEVPPAFKQVASPPNTLHFIVPEGSSGVFHVVNGNPFRYSYYISLRKYEAVQPDPSGKLSAHIDALPDPPEKISKLQGALAKISPFLLGSKGGPQNLYLGDLVDAQARYAQLLGDLRSGKDGRGVAALTHDVFPAVPVESVSAEPRVWAENTVKPFAGLRDAARSLRFDLSTLRAAYFKAYPPTDDSAFPPEVQHWFDTADLIAASINWQVPAALDEFEEQLFRVACKCESAYDIHVEKDPVKVFVKAIPGSSAEDAAVLILEPLQEQKKKKKTSFLSAGIGVDSLKDQTVKVTAIPGTPTTVSTHSQTPELLLAGLLHMPVSNSNWNVAAGIGLNYRANVRGLVGASYFFDRSRLVASFGLCFGPAQERIDRSFVPLGASMPEARTVWRLGFFLA